MSEYEQFIEQETRFIHDLFLNCYSQYSDIPPHTIDYRNKLRLEDKLYAFADLADYLPFLILSSISNTYVIQQLAHTSSLFSSNSLIGNSLPYYLRSLHKKLPFLRIRSFFPDHSLAFSYSDFLFGVNLCSQLGYKDTCFPIFKDIKNVLFQHFFNSNSSLDYALNLKTLKTIPVCDSNNDFFSELFCESAEIFDETNLFDSAKSLIMPSLSSEMFAHVSVVPAITTSSKIHRLLYSRLANKFLLSKNNSSFASSLLASHTNEDIYLYAFDKWFHGIQSLHAKYNALPYSVNFNTGAITFNLKVYAAIDVLLDAFKVLGDRKYLSFALLLADNTLEWLHPDGTIPEYPTSSFFDSCTDFAVSLFNSIVLLRPSNILTMPLRFS